jgi:protein N-terminal methyltransferase
LDVGAGVGRVTKSVLLPLFDDVVLVEPVEKFLKTAYEECLQYQASSENLPILQQWKGMSDNTKSVTFIQGGLQNFDPLEIEKDTICVGRVGYQGNKDTVYDVIWCQWCLGHVSNKDLIKFFERAKAALRSPSEGLIVVKENLCRNHEGSLARTVFDDADSSLTRQVMARTLHNTFL